MLDRTQNNQIKDTLLGFGLSKTEAQVYIAALQQKESTVVTIAEASKLSRGTVFDAVERLKLKGFLAESKKGKRRKIIVENPTNKFYTLLDKKNERLEKEKQLVEEVLPIIKGISATDDSHPRISVYTGEKGFRKVLEDSFTAEDKIWLSVAKIENFIKFAGEDFLKEFSAKKVKMGFHGKAIREDSPLDRKRKSVDKEQNRETRFAPSELKFPSSVMIQGDKVAFFSTRKENTILLIESKDISQTLKSCFEIMWPVLKEKD